jgi:curved DNA-binding protein CbpA
LKADLRTIATKLDSGDALDISGVEDPYLRERLADFLTALPLVKPTAAFTFLKKSHTVPGSILSFIAPILQEDPGTIKQHVYRLEQQQINGHHHHGDDDQVPIDNIPPPQRDDKAPQQQPQPEQQIYIPKQATVKGPAMPPPEYLQAAAAQMQSILPEEEEEEHDDKFMVGPPPPDYALDADAPSSNMRSHEVVRILAILQEHSSNQPKFGTTTTTTTNNNNNNIEELVSLPDAYTILGVSPDTEASEIKKQYWKLSLLIHPDKCDHPGANTAFQAVTQAAQQLQDAGQRVKVDQQRESALLHKAEVEWRAEQERQRQWRIAKGEATAADLAPPPPSSSLAGSNSNKRETWMTELPPERAINTRPDPLAMHSTGFSKSGDFRRGDTSGWTSTPGGGCASEGKHQLEGGGSMRLTTTTQHGGGSGGATTSGNKSATATVIDAYNAANRKLSLLEQHQQAAANAEKKKKKKKKKRQKADNDDEEEEKSPSSSGKHHQHQPAPPPEWRSFDRERDMGPGLGGSKKTSADELMKKLPALDSKFSGGSHQRSFL